MSLTVGRSLSNYRLIAPIGEGGMGVVWRATDSALGRDVAIKVLPDAFVHDAERLARFEREARMLAALNHPHIASIYGLHVADGVRFLAMELVEGEDFAQRLQHGPIPVTEALPLALQIAQALEHAHEKGVIHRDLKPANVKLTTGGTAKVLDFGLAKAMEGETGRAAASSSSMLSQSPTISGALTGVNVLLGTAAYMSPEQARGQVADRRADIWAFGVLLFEMLTGQRLFEGETISDTLAGVLRADPDWSKLPSDTPRRVRELLRRCLERNPKQRLRDIGEARILFEEVIAAGPDAPAPAALAGAPKRGLPLAPIAVAALLLGALATFAVMRVMAPKQASVPLRKFRLALPTDSPPTTPAISPDGRTVAYLSHDQLWIQPLDELEPKSFAVEPGAAQLFWSPDGKWLAYMTPSRIMKMSVPAGEKQAVCDIHTPSSGGLGACWREDGSIVFSLGDEHGLMEVPALGGDPRPLVPIDTSETDMHEPAALPGGRGLIFCSHRKHSGVNNIYVWSGGKRKEVLTVEGQRIADPVYAPSGHILFARAPGTSGVWAVPFSLATLAATGKPFLVAAGGSAPSVSNDNTLAYVPGSSVTSTQMVWVDATGKELGTIGDPEAGALNVFGLSPDGRRVARPVQTGDDREIWVYDAARGTKTRLTFSEGEDDTPAWSLDGTHIAYHHHVKGQPSYESYSLLLRAADGTGSVDTLADMVVPNFVPDRRHLTAVKLLETGSKWNLMEVAIDRASPPRVLVEGNPWVMDGRVSPKGNLMAYMSHESGDWEVYLTRYPSCEGKWQVSIAGGQWPRWNARGDRLFFAQAEDIMAVEVSGTGSPTLGTPRRLFTRQNLGTGSFRWYPYFDVTGDGARFVVLRGAGGAERPKGVSVVQGWVGEFVNGGH